MIIKSILPFIAIGLFLLALLFRRREAGALGWIFIAGYCYFEAFGYFAQDEYFDGSLSLVFLAFSLLLAFLLLKPKSTPMPGEKGEEDLFFTITKIAFITAVFYFPFSEISFLSELLIYITTKITSTALNLLNVGVYMVPPSQIYTISSSFHKVYKPIEIILACTAIQSMVLFIGLIFAVNAPVRRKLKAFFLSVPVIYGLNILRNTFVASAYFGQWFGSPLESFYIAHGVIARIGAMIALIVIAYAVFVILPEALDLVEDFFRFIFKTTKRNN
jgi:archaeosortase A (PGF-CTERM-specific)